MKRTHSILDRGPWYWPLAVGTLAVIGIAFSGVGFAAKGGIPGPPTGGETSNNMSTPAIQTESANQIAAYWSVPTEPELGVHYSYACDVPESDGQYSYPNTSCVDSLSEPSVYYTAEECVTVDFPCYGEEVSRVYWQKVEVNEWWADDDGIFGSEPDSADVAYVDWGDALEAVSWNESSVIRVETQPYASTIPGFDPTIQSCFDAANAAAVDPAVACKIGFQMWHVSGQGITEHWGVRASDDAISYNYDSPFQIIKSTEARLNLTKLEPGTANCSMPGGNPGDEAPVNDAWNGAGWDDWSDPESRPSETCQLADAPYSVETSVGGKYVYGYNWRMRDINMDSICPEGGWSKTGFWRLTFYAPNDVIFVADETITPNVAPPAVLSEVRTLPREEFNTILTPPAEPDGEDSSEDDRLYRPRISPTHNLTYIDICVIAKEGGGGGGGGGGGKPVADTMKPTKGGGKH